MKAHLKKFKFSYTLIMEQKDFYSLQFYSKEKVLEVVRKLVLHFIYSLIFSITMRLIEQKLNNK